MQTQLSPARRRLVTLSILVGMFLAAVDTLVVQTALPTIAGRLGGVSLYAWVVLAYQLTSAATVPVFGRLADAYGRKPLYLVGCAVFILGSMLCANAGSMEALVVWRGVQGVGAGAIIPLTITIVGDVYPLEQRARVQGMISSVWALASILAPGLGALVLRTLGWPWIFYLNLPTGLASMLLLGFSLREPSAEHRLRVPVDLVGAVLLVTGPGTLLLGLQGGETGLGPASLWVLSSVGAVLCGLLVLREVRARHPMLPLHLMHNPLVRYPILGSVLNGAVLTMTVTYVPLLVQGVFMDGPMAVGRAIMPMAIAWPVGSYLGGRLVLAAGYRRTTTLGYLLVAVAGAGLVTTGHGLPRATLYPCMVLAGFGMGVGTICYTLAVQNAVLYNQRGAVTSLLQFGRMMGSVLGLAAAGAMLNRLLAGAPGLGSVSDLAAFLDPLQRSRLDPATLGPAAAALDHGLHAVFLLIWVLALGTLIPSRLLPGGRAAEHVATMPAPAPPPAMDPLETGYTDEESAV